LDVIGVSGAWAGPDMKYLGAFIIV
jgi:hypothetical protein